MKILVDADACPRAIKEVLYRVAERRKMFVWLVANKLLQHPPSQYIRALQVPQGFDVADSKIVELCEPGDMVITADIPLAAEVIARAALVLAPRGELLTAETIQERLAMRNFMETLRSSGVDTGGPAGFSPRDVQQFANQLDRLLAKVCRGGG